MSMRAVGGQNRISVGRCLTSQGEIMLNHLSALEAQWVETKGKWRNRVLHYWHSVCIESRFAFCRLDADKFCESILSDAWLELSSRKTSLDTLRMGISNGNETTTRNPIGFHACRVTRRDCHYWHLGRTLATRSSSCTRGSPEDELPKQHEAACARLPQL